MNSLVKALIKETALKSINVSRVINKNKWYQKYIEVGNRLQLVIVEKFDEEFAKDLRKIQENGPEIVEEFYRIMERSIEKESLEYFYTEVIRLEGRLESGVKLESKSGAEIYDIRTGRRIA